jgi:prevent-host-death family protein
MDDMGIEEARRALGEIVDRARLMNEPTSITRQGKPAAVVVGAEWYAWATGVIDGAADAQAELATPGRVPRWGNPADSATGRFLGAMARRDMDGRKL